jgi:D-arginine dehydrogenase
MTCYKPPVRTTDVAIIGAGFAGCATAFALSGRGVRTVVLERESELGRHASGRGAGLGRQLAEDDATSALAIRGAALLRERFADAWSPTGGILTFDDRAAAEVYVARARSLDVAHELIDRAAVLRHWPAMTGLPIEAAIQIPRDGVIDNRRLLAAYSRDLVIEHGTAVTRIEPAGSGVRIATSNGPFEARVVVDAAGAWAGEATGDPPLASVKRHLFVVEATATAGAPYLWHLGAAELYVRGDAAGVLASPCDAEPTRAMDQQPAANADALLAKLDAAGLRAPITRRWACQRAFAPDRRMKIGRDPRRPWLVWAAALGGHGATASSWIGELAADAVVAALA